MLSKYIYPTERECMKMNYDNATLESWIRKVSEVFYEGVYRDSWLKQIFQVPQDHITNQQVDFMVGALGGPERYCGRNPQDAHTHIYIPEDMWVRREEHLLNAFREVGCPEDIQDIWLKIENAFKKRIVMQDSSECRKRYPGDDLIIVEEPYKKSA
jgi:hemoglobin